MKVEQLRPHRSGLEKVLKDVEKIDMKIRSQRGR